MSFDLAQTPTVEAVSIGDEALLAHDLQARVDESIRDADQSTEVIAAMEAQTTAIAKLARLRKAERSLSAYAKESRERVALKARAALDAIIESAAEGGKPEFVKLGEVATIENQNRYSMRAIERMVEHLIPLSQIASLREESHALMTKARVLERIAQNRAEKVLGKIRDAVSDEIVLPVDLSKGVAGALIAQAAELKRCAIQISENADELARVYERRRTEERP
jgi:hypothetical protein